MDNLDSVFGEKETKEEKLWKQIESEMSPQVKEIRGNIKFYHYTDKHSATITDEKVCVSFLKSLNSARMRVFDMADLLFELQLEKNLNNILLNLSDDIDIFSDEVKMRYCEWNDIPKNFLRKLVERDLDIMSGLKKLNHTLDEIYNYILKELKKHKRGRYYLDNDFWFSVKEEILKTEHIVNNLAIAFKERESICNIKPVSFEKTFASIQEHIRQSM
jgi:hypothetical protein